MKKYTTRTLGRSLRDDDEIPPQVKTAWKGVSENFLNKVSSKKIEPPKLDNIFVMWGNICAVMELEPIEIAQNWFKKYIDDASEARSRLKNLASGMSESEFEALVG